MSAVTINSLMAGTGVIGVDIIRYTQPDRQDVSLLDMVRVFIFDQDAVQLSGGDVYAPLLHL